jgi:probable phosphoglycerate mutase
MPHEIWLIRHGETEWSLSGAHTGRTDIPLTEAGRKGAAQIGEYLAGRAFALVLTSPLLRARDTCRLAGFGAVAEIEPNLQEWDYGDYEGLTTRQIREERPGWSLWRDGTPNGESVEHAAARAQAVIERALDASGDVALFAHGHILRILAGGWLGLQPNSGQLFALSTASLSTLGYEREARVITRWNLSVSQE